MIRGLFVDSSFPTHCAPRNTVEEEPFSPKICCGHLRPVVVRNRPSESEKGNCPKQGNEQAIILSHRPGTATVLLLRFPSSTVWDLGRHLSLPDATA